MDNQKDVYAYIKSEEKKFKTAKVPITKSKDWNMSDHIERCTAVANAFYYTGINDGVRPYNDIVTPILNVAFRSEGFDVKDVVPYVNDSLNYYKSFLVKKFHPQWARKHQLDTFIDDVVETSVIYDLVLIQDINNVRPEVVDLKTIAFCDQTDIMAGPICIKYQMTPADLNEYRDRWDANKIDEAIVMASAEKEVSIAGDQKVQTPSKYIVVYVLRGNLPESWKKEGGNPNKYVPQMKVICYYKSEDGSDNGITLYEGLDKPLNKVFKALKIDRIRSKGRACGRSIVESLFEEQVWANYDAIKIKEMLDSAFSVIVTDSEELGNQKLTDLKRNTILKQGKGDSTQRIDASLGNLTAFTNDKASHEQNARILGSASESQLGVNPTSGTPFALQQLVVQQGQGIHEYRQGKIATFFSDIIYPELILDYLVKDMNGGKAFSEVMTLDEIQEVAKSIATNEVEESIQKDIMKTGVVPTMEEREILIEKLKQDIIDGKTPKYSNGRGFMETVSGELDEIPTAVFINIKSKQRNMAQNADKISNLVRETLKNPGAIANTPGVGKLFNELIEESGYSPINFVEITKSSPPPPQPNQSKGEVVPPQINNMMV